MSGRIKNEREYLRFVSRIMDESGVDWSTRRNSVGHLVIEFVRNGKPITIIDGPASFDATRNRRNALARVRRLVQQGVQR